MEKMFYECTALSTLNLTGLETGKVTNMQNMFANCRALQTLDLSSFDVRNVKSMMFMFQGCRNLTTIYSGNWTLNSTMVSNGDDWMMFDACDKLVGGSGTTYAYVESDLDASDSELARIDGGPTSNTPGFFTDPAEKP